MVLIPIILENLPIGKSTNMVLFLRKKNHTPLGPFFPLVLFPSIRSHWGVKDGLSEYIQRWG